MRVRGVDQVDEIIEKCDAILHTLEEMGKSPNNNKVLERRYSVNEAAQMVGRSRASLGRAEKEGVVSPDKDKKTNRTLGYSLEEVNKLRSHYKTGIARKDGDPCLTIAVQSFKGGVSKSVTTVHFAQYLAQKGYKVLVVDCDPQASATSSFGFLPDQYFEEEDTLIPYLDGVQESIDYAIIETYFPNIHLIPSCLPLYEAEFKLALGAAEAETPDERRQYFFEFSTAFDEVKPYYDVILLDSPPALGMITINILVASDALIVPTPPSLYDFSSTVQYFRMIHRVMTKIAPQKTYEFIKILATRVDTRKTTHVEFLSIMKDIFGKHMLDKAFLQTAEIENCAAQFKTVYDLSKPQKRAFDILNNVFQEIETCILKSWKTKKSKLIEEGVI